MAAQATAVVFGGSGFVGHHLSMELLGNGFRVVVCDLIAPRFRQSGLEYEKCDVRSPIKFSTGEVALVANLAAIHRTPGHEEHEYYETNVRGALNVTAWCAANSVPTAIFTSSISVYGPTEELVTEDSPLLPNSSYGRSKLIAEEIHKAWFSDGADRTLLVARPAVLFGAGENGNFTRLAKALARRRFAFPGRTDTIKSCGYIKDFVNSLSFMRGKNLGESAVYNFAYPERYTIEEICATFTEVAGFARPVTVPAPVMKAAEFILPKGSRGQGRNINAERVRKLALSTNVYPARLLSEGYAFRTDLASALVDWRTVVHGRSFFE